MWIERAHFSHAVNNKNKRNSDHRRHKCTHFNWWTGILTATAAKVHILQLSNCGQHTHCNRCNEQSSDHRRHKCMHFNWWLERFSVNRRQSAHSSTADGKKLTTAEANETSEANRRLHQKGRELRPQILLQNWWTVNYFIYFFEIFFFCKTENNQIILVK